MHHLSSLRRACLFTIFCILPVPTLAQVYDTSSTMDRAGVMVRMGREVAAETSDGVRLMGRIRDVKGSTATVLLLPMFANPIESYEAVMIDLERVGVSSVAFDLRGQWSSTQSTSGPLDYRTFTAQDWQQLVSDVGACAGWVKREQGELSAIVGANVSATAALIYAASNPSVPRVLLLSPFDEWSGMNALSAVPGYGKRPMAIFIGEHDQVSSGAVRLCQAARAAGSQVIFDVEPGFHHGSAGLAYTARQRAVRWLATGVYVPLGPEWTR